MDRLNFLSITKVAFPKFSITVVISPYCQVTHGNPQNQMSLLFKAEHRSSIEKSVLRCLISHCSNIFRITIIYIYINCVWTILQEKETKMCAHTNLVYNFNIISNKTLLSMDSFDGRTTRRSPFLLLGPPNNFGSGLNNVKEKSQCFKSLAHCGNIRQNFRRSF